jgi:hypothetical protein
VSILGVNSLNEQTVISVNLKLKFTATLFYLNPGRLNTYINNSVYVNDSLTDLFVFLGGERGIQKIGWNVNTLLTH